MQYNRKADGTLRASPAKVIDTGMDSNVYAWPLQGKKKNFTTPTYSSLIDKIGQLAGMEYGKDAKVDIAMRVIADHVRTIAFSIADPSCLATPKPVM